MHNLCLLTLLVPVVLSYPSGAPPRACDNMVPGHFVKSDPDKPKIEAQNSAMPYTLTINPKVFSKNLLSQRLIVTLSGMQGNLIRGFFLQARYVDSTKNPDVALGRFVPEAGTKTINCGGGQNNAITHSRRLNVNSVTVRWESSAREKAHIQFILTVVQTYEIFWNAELMTDQVIEHPDIPAPQLKYDINPETNIYRKVGLPPFEATGCGTAKGCYRHPRGCAPTYCTYFLSWIPDVDVVNFELMAKTSSWVAVGFSDDKNMGEDSVIQCAYHGQGQSLVGESVNTNQPNNVPIPPSSLIDTSSVAEFKDGYMRCQFSRTKIAGLGDRRVKDINKPVYVLMAKGDSKNGQMMSHDMSFENGPIVSPDKINLGKISDIDGKASYPLIKAHAILMILAFVLCASSGILIARYYKPMWPNNRSCGDRIWFSTHRTLMINTLILVIIAFILIFIEAGGYSKMDKPWMVEAHPIIGIIVTCLVIINPIMAIFRCDPKARCRPCYNWFHWLVGTIALVLATLNIFFGMNISKANVPWWVTWVMVIWVIIHFIVEITLEIHQCCVHKKNKRRREDYELKKRTDIHGEPILEPEPAGRRFKNGMLAFYVTITVILVLIMVLSILILS